MTPERLAEIDLEINTSWWPLGNTDARLLIAHIRDLEAQLAAAEEECQRIRDWLATTATPPSLPAKERQRRSFAYGNVHIDNPNVTREMVDRVAERLASKPPSPEVK